MALHNKVVWLVLMKILSYSSVEINTILWYTSIFNILCDISAKISEILQHHAIATKRRDFAIGPVFEIFWDHFSLGNLLILNGPGDNASQYLALLNVQKLLLMIILNIWNYDLNYSFNYLNLNFIRQIPAHHWRSYLSDFSIQFLYCKLMRKWIANVDISIPKSRH